MFEVRCIVSDKALSRVLVALNGLTLEPPVVVPASSPSGNATPKNTTTEVLRAFVMTKKPKEVITTRTMREWLISQGFTGSGYSFALKQLLTDKTLKKGKVSFTYERIGE